jgi:regulator of protease activity HflC (stomatin/prohibitin superfamily)
MVNSYQQDEIDKIATYQRPVADLLNQLTPQNVPNVIGVVTSTKMLNGGKEDSNVVLENLEHVIKPCQIEMEKVSVSLGLEPPELQSKVEVLPKLMKGHMLELSQAINAQSAEQQAREVKEVQETLDEFLQLASSKYKFKPYVPSVAMSDADMFGPFGCEFWGKVRKPESNKCVLPANTA